MTLKFDQEDQNTIHVGNSSFMPYYLIYFDHLTGVDMTVFDIWEVPGKVIDIDKLNNYIEPVIIHRNRSSEKDLRIIKKMKMC